jgi:hypothetical protein
MLEFLQPNWLYLALPVGLLLLWMHRTAPSKLPLVAFGAMRFIRQVLSSEQNSKKWQHWLLMLLRMLLLLCLITAFANPIWQRPKATANVPCVGIVLDFTASMYRSINLQNQYPCCLYDQARMQIDALLKSLPSDVPVMLYVLTDQLYPMIPEPSFNRIQLHNEIQSKGNVFASGNFTQLASMKHWPTLSEIHLFTDSQAVHFPNPDDWQKMFAGKTCIVHDVSDAALPNMAITDIHWQDQSTPQSRQGQLHFTIQSDSPDLLHRELAIKINDTVQHKQSIQLSSNQTITLSIPVILPAGKLAIGAVLMDRDALEWDDMRYLVLKPWTLPDVHAMDQSDFAIHMSSLLKTWGMDAGENKISRQSLMFMGDANLQQLNVIDESLKQGATIIWLLGDDAQAKHFNQWSQSHGYDIAVSTWQTISDKPQLTWQWMRDDPWLDIYAGSYNATLNQMASQNHLPLAGDFSTWHVLATLANQPVIAARSVDRGQMVILAIRKEQMSEMLGQPDTAGLLLHLGSQALQDNRLPIAQPPSQVGDVWHPQLPVDITDLHFQYPMGFPESLDQENRHEVSLTTTGFYGVFNGKSYQFLDVASVVMNDSEVSQDQINPLQYTIYNTPDITLANQQQIKLWPWLFVMAFGLAIVEVIYVHHLARKRGHHVD